MTRCCIAGESIWAKQSFSYRSHDFMPSFQRTLTSVTPSVWFTWNTTLYLIYVHHNSDLRQRRRIKHMTTEQRPLLNILVHFYCPKTYTSKWNRTAEMLNDSRHAIIYPCQNKALKNKFNALLKLVLNYKCNLYLFGEMANVFIQERKDYI